MVGVVRVFDSPLIVSGASYLVQVCARPAGTIWEGWIEFQSDRGTWHRTPRETTQPDLAAVHYWAGGLSTTYLEGALQHRWLTSDAAEDIGGAVFQRARGTSVTAGAGRRRARCLDPFAVGAKGETLLRRELGALRAWHLRNIVRAYELNDEDADLEQLSEEELVELIVDAVVAA